VPPRDKRAGFDACIDHGRRIFRNCSRRRARIGVDVYFENVGVPVFDAVLPLFQYVRALFGAG